MKRADRSARAVAKALGADLVVPLGKIEHTPFGYIALTDRVHRLRSTGPRGSGRPSNPEATLPRIVKFKPGTWNLLKRVASAQARTTGRRVSPAQVASILIEEALKRGCRKPG